MNCSHCGKAFDPRDSQCPHCGRPRPDASGVFQTSTVLISTEAADLVYRSVDEVPDRLRSRLLKSTNSPNSATILIADRKGRRAIAKAMRSLPGTTQRRLARSLLGDEDRSGSYRWLTPTRKKLILAAVSVITLGLISFVFSYRW
jgi:hypothetical protein